jgi:hypothetical protein
MTVEAENQELMHAFQTCRETHLELDLVSLVMMVDDLEMVVSPASSLDALVSCLVWSYHLTLEADRA